MCGIVGIVGLEDRALIRKMADVVSHRGPDDRGYYVDKDISFGHRRLSIIDLSEKGRQPMHNEDGSIVVVYNGEIYNYLELKERLSKRHKFYSNTDTEVIVHAYEEYGENCVNHFRGMFAFAVWDKKKKRLFLARDRLGIKPLYYAIIGKAFVFASEIKSILQYGISREVDLTALSDYFTLRFVNGPRTMFKGIQKLQPGHYLIFEGNKIYIRKYWNLGFETEVHSQKYYIKNFLQLMEESVRMRLMSDVPLGAYISGGIDSGTVTYFMSKLMKEPVKTFSVGFGLEEHKDELEHAAKIAEHFKTEHKELIVKPNAAKILPQVVWHFDEPVADPAAIPTYMLSELAKKKVTVVLTGEGGDELFAGYEQYRIIKAGKKLRFVPGFLRSRIPSIVKKIPSQYLNKFFKYSESLGEKGMERFNYFLNSLNNNIENYLNLVAIFDENEKEELLCKKEKIDVDFSALYPRRDWLSGLLEFETKIELPDNLLMKVDKMTMAHAVEARVPFLDHKLVEFSATIPPRLKLRGFNEKYILRRAMKDKLPKRIVTRKKERFFVPIDIWFTKDLKEMALNVLNEGSIRREGLLKYSYVEKIFNNYKKSRLYYARQLWSLLNFEIWHKLYIERGFIYNPSLKRLI